MPANLPVTRSDASAALHGVNMYSEDPAYVMATVGRYLVQVVRHRMTTTAVSALRRALTDLSAAYPTFGYLGVIEPGAQIAMPPDVREGVDACVKRFTQSFTGAAIVFEKTGFHATALRSVVTGINFASRATHPSQVFSDLRAGISWLSSLTPGEPTPGRLMQIVKQLRGGRSTEPGASPSL